MKNKKILGLALVFGALTVLTALGAFAWSDYSNNYGYMHDSYSGSMYGSYNHYGSGYGYGHMHA